MINILRESHSGLGMYYVKFMKVSYKWLLTMLACVETTDGWDGLACVGLFRKKQLKFKLAYIVCTKFG
jgi:hypothetical protein